MFFFLRQGSVFPRVNNAVAVDNGVAMTKMILEKMMIRQQRPSAVNALDARGIDPCHN